MPKAPSSLTSPKIKKLATKAQKSPSMLSTAETRELGASVMAHLQTSALTNGKGASTKVALKKTAAKKTASKKAAAKKTSAKK